MSTEDAPDCIVQYPLSVDDAPAPAVLTNKYVDKLRYNDFQNNIKEFRVKYRRGQGKKKRRRRMKRRKGEEGGGGG